MSSDKTYPSEPLDQKRVEFESEVKRVAVERFGYSEKEAMLKTIFERNSNGLYAVEWARGAWEGFNLAQARTNAMSTDSVKQELDRLAKRYSLNAAGMLNSGAPEHAQTIAIVELLSNFDVDEADSHWESIMAYSDLRTSDALFSAAETVSMAVVLEGTL